MRALLYLPLEIVTALLFAASIGIGAGVVAISYTHRLGDGVGVALAAFMVAGAGFGYAIWRTYRPSSRSVAHAPRLARMSAQR